MTKRNCLIVELILAVIAALVFFFYPVLSFGNRIINVATQLTGGRQPDETLVLLCVVYVVSVILLYLAMERQSAGHKSALLLSVLGVILLSGYPAFVLIETGGNLNLGSGYFGESHGEYYGILIAIAVALIVLEIIYYNLQEDKAPAAVRSSADAGEEGAGLTDEKQEEYASILSQKTDDELKAIVQDSGAYDAAFISQARGELMERVMGKRRQMSAEEIRLEEERRRAEEERLRREEEERRRQEEEERQREKEERQRIWEEQRRQEAVAMKKGLKRFAIVAAIVVPMVVAGGYMYWNQTPARLIERGQAKYDAGEKEEGKKLLRQAEEKDQTGTAVDALYRIYSLEGDDEMAMGYTKKAADLGLTAYCARYGLHLAESDDLTTALPYLREAYPYFNDAEDTVEKGRIAYFLGNSAYQDGEINQAKKYWEAASEMGSAEARVRLGDWYLCHGDLSVNCYKEALEYYEKAYIDSPGLKDRIKILRDLKQHSSWQYHGFDGGDALRCEDVYGWGDLRIKRGVYSWKDGQRFYGKFDADNQGVNAPGIMVYRPDNGACGMYVGDMRFINRRWVRYGQGTFVNPNGESGYGKWVNEKETGKHTVVSPSGKKTTITY